MDGKKILILELLEILQNYTDENHGLTQQNIIEILEKDYGYENVRRQTIKDNLEKLRNIKMDNFEIMCEEETKSKTKDKKTGEEKETVFYTDFKYVHKFTEGELRLIIDSILFSKHIDLSHRKELIEKLEALTSKHFKSGMNHIKAVDSNHKGNKELFWNIEELNKAITNSKKVSFNYESYKYEEKTPSLVTRKNSKGEDRKYIINPYYMVASKERYYLICNNEAFNNVSSYRIDRIKNIEVLENEKRKPIRDVEGLGENFNLNQYVAEHIYMFAGESDHVKLSLKEEFLDEFIDSFGFENINFQGKKDNQILAGVKANRMAMRKGALRYSLYARVLSPSDLVDDIKSYLLHGAYMTDFVKFVEEDGELLAAGVPESNSSNDIIKDELNERIDIHARGLKEEFDSLGIKPKVIVLCHSRLYEKDKNGQLKGKTIDAITKALGYKPHFVKLNHYTPQGSVSKGEFDSVPEAFEKREIKELIENIESKLGTIIG